MKPNLNKNIHKNKIKISFALNGRRKGLSKNLLNYTLISKFQGTRKTSDSVSLDNPAASNCIE